MSFSLRHNMIINNLIEHAKTSQLNFKLSAVLVSGSRPISSPVVNSDSRYCRGKCQPSLHAEGAALLKHCGKFLTYSDKKGWCFLREKGKEQEVT